MELLQIIIFGLLGVAVGSFLNVCIDRLPAGKSLLRPPSHCDGCQRRLSFTDLIPIASYLWLRGRCRYCGAGIPQRVLWVEAGTGLMLGLLHWHYGLSAEFAVTAFYFCVFIVLLAIDLDHKLILNKITYPVMLIALIIDAFVSPPGTINGDKVINGIIGGAVGFAFLMVPVLIYRRGMGLGDVKMAALIGLAVGFPLVLVSLILAIVAGGVIAILLLVLKKKGRKEAIPFGPFLALAAMATLVWGDYILKWYLSFFLF